MNGPRPSIPALSCLVLLATLLGTPFNAESQCGSLVLSRDGFEGFVAPVTPLSFIPDTAQVVSYTASCGEDADYRTHPPYYSVDPVFGTVMDNVTGLEWQEPDAGFYTWYEATGTADATYNPDGATDVCGDLDLGGHQDWRLPTRRELLRIVDFDRSFFAINDVFTSESLYWSAGSRDSVNAWYVRFTGINTNYVSYWVQKFNTYFVRCVRGPEDTPEFVDNGNGTVSDRVSGLMWQQTDLVDGQPPAVTTWEQALAQCEALDLGGHDDWRLPNITELESIRTSAGLVTVASLASQYWSSTTTAYQSDVTPQVWTLNFQFGYVFYRDKTTFSYGLCARTEVAGD